MNILIVWQLERGWIGVIMVTIIKKRIVLIIVSSIVLFLFIKWIIPVLYLGGIIPFPPSYAKIDNCLVKDINLLSEVVKQLEDLEYDSITIQSTYDCKSMNATNPDGYGGHTGGDIPIPNEKLKENIKLLFTKGYVTITKGNEHYDFTKWSAFSESRGMIFTVDKIALGKNAYEGDQEIDISPLSIANWYYYEHKCDR